MYLSKNLRGRFAPVWLLMILAVVIFFITRLCLLLQCLHADLHISQVVGSFFIGLLYDITVAGVFAIPLLLQLWFQNDFIYNKKIIAWIDGLLVVMGGLLLFTNALPNGLLRKVLFTYIAIRFCIYNVLAALPYRFRVSWRRIMLYTSFSLILFFLLFNAVSEWYIWQEFSARYGFVTVDNIMYATEVTGDIEESYHVFIIIPSLLAIAVFTGCFFYKTFCRSVVTPASFIVRSGMAAIVLAVAATVFLIPEKWRHFSKNEYANELAGNGLFQFGYAYIHNHLSFYQSYQTLPDAEAFTIVRNDMQLPGTPFTSNDIYSTERSISSSIPEQHYNVVLISVESMSASFMKAFGNHQNLTPCLDSLAKKSLFFTNFYAAGTRTVRGLEALTLSIPPTPGQSTVKRPDNKNLFSLGSVFESHGYTSQFLYGGNSRFDNMKMFFSNNGYDVIDHSAFQPKDIDFESVWGVADEDLFDMALRTMDKNAALKKPFFSHIMTVSNHRPFRYPEGRIDIPAATQTREGAVKYTDWAINRFLREASTKPWFDSTVFVIVADHCASAAGIAKLPVTGYHIPLLIFAPKLVQPQVFSGLASQLDVAPTVLGLLHFQYRSKFFGQDVLNTPVNKERAFISTYDGLGFLKNGKLVIQEPGKKVSEFLPDNKTGSATAIPLTDSLVKKAIAYYQCASWLMKNNKYNTR